MGNCLAKTQRCLTCCKCVVKGWPAEHKPIPRLDPSPNPPGPGTDQILALTSRWESLNSDVYPGAGPGTLTPDGRLDPLLAYAYDAVFSLAGGIGAEQMTANTWRASLRGFVTERYLTARTAVGVGGNGSELVKGATFGFKTTCVHHW